MRSKGFFKEYSMRLRHSLIYGLALQTLWALSPLLTAAAEGPERIYRCGNQYTNAPARPQDCQVMQAQTITVIQGTRPAGAVPRPAMDSTSGPNKMLPTTAQVTAAAGFATSGSVDAQARGAQQRAILVAELQQTRQQHAQLVLEYNAGEPDKVGGEARNHQKYLDRLANLKAGIARAERDMDSLQRELSRLPSTPQSLISPP